MNTPKIISRQKVRHMQHHIVDGFICSQKGIQKLYKEGIITISEYQELMEKNLDRFQVRLKEWRVAEKMLSLFFAALFSFMAFTSSDDELYRRGRRGRSGRRSQGRNEYVVDSDLDKED